MADSLLPSNASAQELALEAATARIGAVPVPVDTLFDPQRCPTSHLPWLAWSLSVDYWRSDWPEATKRRVIAASVDVHRRKGTIGAVRRALTALGSPPEIVEWFDAAPAAEPGTFLLTTWANDADPATVFDGAFFTDALAVIAGAKRESQHPTFRAGAALDGAIGLGAIAIGQQRLRAELTPAGGLIGGLVLGAGTDAASIHHARMTVS
ncbi:MAG: phage tail protein I [Magnetospirillum sp.]|nr:phage tail protein I [Magnetospirillum sp.]